MSDSHANPLTKMLQSVFSDNSNIMLAAIISLLLVILFVLLLHLYAKWFLAHAHAQAQARRRSRRRRPASVTVSDVIGPARFHRFHTFNLQDSPIYNSPTKGLDSASIAAIPVFVYEAETVEEEEEEGDEPDLECVICLSVFEDGETGRSLPKCGHAFHVGCIDMWLSSHSNCPICRAPIGELDSQLGSVHLEEDSSAVLDILIDSPSSETSENDHGTESISISTNHNANDSDNDNGGASDPAISISETSSSLLGCSLKRMFSKVFPSSNVTERST